MPEFDFMFFKMSINELCKSASRAMYILLGNTNKYLSDNIKLLIDLFDKIIAPICTYNCEIWGRSLFPKSLSLSNFLSSKQCKNLK